MSTYGLGKRPPLEDVVAKYRPVIGSPVTRAYVVEIEGRAVGYVQTYRILDHPRYAAEVGIEDESHGLDLFLGEPSLVGRGLGPLVIATFAATEVFGRTPAVAIVADPPSTNRRSVRAFEKAGFRLWRRQVPTSPECGDLLMRLERTLGPP